MTNPTPHGQVPEALIDMIDAYAESRHRCGGGIYNAMTEAARNAVIEALSGMQALSAAPEAIAKLRHLYQNMVNGAVRDTASAKRIAEGLLAPAIEALERATPPAEQQAASSAVLKAIREANMQLVRTGDDAFMLVPYKLATEEQQAAPKAAPGEPDKLMRDCLALLERFDYEDDEDSQSKAFFKAHINADWFFHVKHSIERQLEAKAAPQQEAQEPVATLHCDDIGYVWAWVTEVGTRMRFEQPINLYTAPQPAPAPLSERDAFEAAWEKLHGKRPVLWSHMFAEHKMETPSHSEGKYFARDEQAAWKLWQARAALAAQGGK